MRFKLSMIILLFSWPVLATTHCHGRLLRPINDINWAMIFPIRIAGMTIAKQQGSVDSDRTLTSPLCWCPSQFLGMKVKVPGVVISYHEPLYIEEIVKTPGCLSALGGIQLLHGFDRERTDLKMDTNSSSRWQVHWYVFPVLALLNLFGHFSCLSVPGFSLVYLSELDPTWQNDSWAAVYAPEATLFANRFAQAACALDAASSNQSKPMDDLFWCAGSWGPLYPLTGNANTAIDPMQSANLVGAKMMARLARMGFLWDTVGAEAMCHSQAMPLLIKSEFSIDPIYPRVSHATGMPIGGSTALWEYDPPQVYPGHENINQLIFQQQQCCLRP